MDAKIVDCLLELSRVLTKEQRDSIADTTREFLDRVEQIQLDVRSGHKEEANLRLRNLFSHLWVFHIACVAPQGLVNDDERKQLIEMARRQEYGPISRVYDNDDENDDE